MEQVWAMLGLKTHALTYSYELDDINKFGFTNYYNIDDPNDKDYVLSIGV